MSTDPNLPMPLLPAALRILYSFLFYLLVPLLALRLLWRGCRAPAYFHHWRERFGRDLPQPGKRVIWVHAVSVGEVQASVPLVRALLNHYPGYSLLVTTMTPTGAAQVKKSLGHQVTHCYLPYDLPSAIARFLERIQPQFGLIMETEIWPNLLRQCRRRGVPLMLVNARLSKRSARGYFRLGALTRDILSDLTFIATQGSTDAKRFIVLGAPAERVHVVGNLKFDLKPPANLPPQAAALKRCWGKQRPVWIVASTHEGEEAQILIAFKQIQRAYPAALLLLVPRHPERFSRVYLLCQRQGFITRRRSTQGSWDPATEIFLGDTMGELPLFYAASDIAFIGGSLVPTGGHNPLEPAVLERAIIFGPYMFNFAAISRRLLATGAALQIKTPQELAQAVLHYLDKPQLRAKAGKAGSLVIAQSQGTTEKLLQLIKEQTPQC